MTLDASFITMVAKKEYKDFEKVLNTEVESKLKSHLSGFTNYLEKTTFAKEE